MQEWLNVAPTLKQVMVISVNTPEQTQWNDTSELMDLFTCERRIC